MFDENTTYLIIITASNHFGTSQSDPVVLRVKDIGKPVLLQYLHRSWIWILEYYWMFFFSLVNFSLSFFFIRVIWFLEKCVITWCIIFRKFFFYGHSLTNLTFLSANCFSVCVIFIWREIYLRPRMSSVTISVNFNCPEFLCHYRICSCFCLYHLWALYLVSFVLQWFPMHLLLCRYSFRAIP